MIVLAAGKNRRTRLLGAALALVTAAASAVALQATQADNASAADCLAMTAPVHQRVNPVSQANLLTRSPAESDNAAARYGFTEDHGRPFRAGSAAATGLSAVHRLYQATSGDFVWIARSAEIANAVRSFGYVDQGPDFFASATSVGCSTPVHRFLRAGKHRYAVTAADRAALVAAGWRAEGPSFFAGPASSAPTPGTSVPAPTPSASPTRSATPTASPTTAGPKPTATPTTSRPAGGFVHPGIVVGRTQLDFVKAKLAAGAEPWTSALAKARASKADTGTNSGVAYSSLSWTPHPVATVGCAAYNRVDEGCSDEVNDAMAAYTHALLWAYTGNTANAQQAVRILNAWSGTLVDHRFDLQTYTNGHLQAAWAGEIFPKAAEILRYTYRPAAGSPSLDVARFSRMLRTAFLPHVIDGWSGAGANWLTSMAEATMNIGVFLDDKAVFDNGVGDWRGVVPSMIFLKGDVNPHPQLAGLPISAPGTMYDRASTTATSMRSYWHSPTSFPSGLEGETCRDINHMAMGFGGMINAAETARIQGLDLYGEQKKRITTALELNLGYISSALAGTNPPPGWACAGRMDTTNGAWKVTWEIAYNHYANRLGMSLPNTSAFLTRTVRPAGYRAAGFLQYETLTHFSAP